MAAGLIGTGQAYKRQAIAGLNQAANLEARRNAENRQIKSQQGMQHMQNLGTGLATGATIGAAFGPVGAGVGAVAGLLAGELF